MTTNLPLEPVAALTRQSTSTLKDALLRALQVSEVVGCRAVLVHAKDAAALGFYRKFGFESSPTDEAHLFMLMKDIEAMARASA